VIVYISLLTTVSHAGENIISVSTQKSNIILLHFFYVTIINVLWIRNCSANSKTMTLHVLDRLSGSQRTLLRTQQRAEVFVMAAVFYSSCATRSIRDQC